MRWSSRVDRAVVRGAWEAGRRFSGRRGRRPAEAILAGALAAAAGTLAMDFLGYLRYRQGGGDQDFSTFELSAPQDWEKTSAPGQVGKRIVEGLTQRELSPRYAPLVSSIVHWSYGVGWGALYGVVAGSLRRPPVWLGLLHGTTVWLTGYAVLPVTGLYQPITEYDRKTLAGDLASHLIYGGTTGLVFRVLSLF